MRLLFISNLFPDTTQPWRGLDNVTLLHAMKAARPEAEIRVLCLRPGHGYWIGRGCDLQPRPGDDALSPSFHWAPYVPRFGGLNDVLFQQAVTRALKTLPVGWRPDALLVPWLFPDACGVDRCADLAGLPMAAVAQGSDVHRYLKMPWRRRSILRLLRRAHVMTRSDDLRRQLLAEGGNAHSVTTVYNGVHTDVFRPGDKTAARQALSLPAVGQIVLFVGNFLPVKGLDLLIRACALARPRLPGPLHLVMIGSGPLEAELLALAQSSGLGRESVIIAGRKASEEVAQFMRAADAVCLSSLNEGVPNVVLEALASGRPLVSTDVGGIGEVVRPIQGAGVLVPGRSPATYADALVATLQGQADPEALSRAAAPFSWSRCASIYWGVLDSATIRAIREQS